MKVSNNWLKSLVNYPTNTKQLIEDMESIGHELESYKRLVDATGLVVGEVIEVAKHPEADKLNVCKVNLGSEVVTIVCGAPNVRANIKVIVATVGAILPGNFKIGKAKLKGIESNGMICSIQELGFDNKYLTEEDKTGIHILSETASVGSDPLAFLNFDDEVIDFNITPNRGDMLSMLGVAREVSALYNLDLPKLDANVDATVKVNLELLIDTDNCPLYTARVVKDVVIKESPAFMKARLMASGIRPINNVVDISNYVMLLTGQPLHFFDYEKIGNIVGVRMANAGEELVTLDNVNRKLSADQMVITDGIKPVALAGVMGGLDSEVTEKTTKLLIESAIFKAGNIRKTAKSILQSEASMRFERGVAKVNTYLAQNLAADLLIKYADAREVSNLVVVDNQVEQVNEIKIEVAKINRVLGDKLTDSTIISILNRLGMEVVNNNGLLLIKTPSHRLDLTIPEDITEEVGRLYGINNIPSVLPVTPAKAGSLSTKRKYLKNINKYMEALGFNQVITYTLTHAENTEMMYVNNLAPIMLQSPMSTDRTHLRTTLIPEHIKVMNYNKARNINDLMFYETGEVYYKDNNEFKQKTLLSGLLTGSYVSSSWQGINVSIDFYTLKGLMESLLNYLGFEGRYQFKSETYTSAWHPGMTATIYVDETKIGKIGAISPVISKVKPFVFELEIDTLMSLKTTKIKHVEPSKYPTIVKDVAFVVKQDISAAQIVDLIIAAGGNDLIEVSIFDVYTGDKINASEKSIAFKLTFQNDEKTLTDEEVTAKFNRIIKKVTMELNAQVRDF